MESQTKPQSSSRWWPPEILINILLKLPAKTLIKLWLVCKQWHATVYPTLSYNYRSLAPKDSICMIQNIGSTTEVSLHELGGMILPDASLVSKRTMSIKYSRKGYSGLSSMCNGLLCLSFYSRVVVCNPTTREFLTLPSPIITRGKHWRSVAIGYIPHTRTYKILVSTRALQCEIFTLGSNSWKTVGDAPHMLDRYCVSISGEIYWWTNKDFIISFDVEKEKFGLISLPKDLVGLDYQFDPFRLDVIEMEGRLGLMHHMDCEKAVWILKDRKCHEWVKVRTFDCDEFACYGIATGIQDEKVLHCEDVIFCHDLQKKRQADVVFGEDGTTLRGKSAYFYAENLVFLKNIDQGM